MEEASDRKKRLREMRERAQGQAQAQGEESDKPQLKFRNYKPQDKALRPAESAANDENKQDNSAAKLNPIQQELQAQEESEEISIAPRKINWDLKRDVEKKLEKLRKRTTKAIVEILREKYAEQDGEGEGGDGEEESEA